MSILECAVDGTTPTKNDISQLEDAINDKATIEYCRLSSGTPVYRIAQLSGLRLVGEELFRYFKLIFECGPVHARCERCSALFITKRGGKKFCSPECLAQRWSYKARSEYYKEYQRSNVTGVRKGGKH